MTQGDLRSLLHKLPYQGPGYRRPKGAGGGGSPPPPDPGPGPSSYLNPEGSMDEGRMSGHKPENRPSSSHPLPPPSPPPRPPVSTFRPPVSYSHWRPPPGQPPLHVDPEWQYRGRHPRPKPPRQGHYSYMPPPAESGVYQGPSITRVRVPSAVVSYSSGNSFSEEEEDLRRRESRLHDQEVRMREREREVQLREQEARLRVEIEPRLRGDRAEQMRAEEQVHRSEQARRVVQDELRREEAARRLERRGNISERE